MKKIIALLLVSLMLLASFAVVASAENFVPSIGVKPSPDVDGEENEDGDVVIGHVVDKDGNILSDEYHDCIVVTPVSEARTSKRIPKAAADLLLKVYGEISAEDYKLSSMSDALNKMAEADLGEGKDADDLVVKELFDVTVLCEELETLLAVDGNVITLDFKVSVPVNTPVYVLTYIDGKWEPIVKTVNNGGTLSCTFEYFCPVAFLVPVDNESDEDDSGNNGSGDNDDNVSGDNGSDNSDNVSGDDGNGGSDDSEGDTPQTGDDSNKTFWAFVMFGSLILAVALIVVSRRRVKMSEN